MSWGKYFKNFTGVLFADNENTPDAYPYIIPADHFKAAMNDTISSFFSSDMEKTLAWNTLSKIDHGIEVDALNIAEILISIDHQAHDRMYHSSFPDRPTFKDDVIALSRTILDAAAKAEENGTTHSQANAFGEKIAQIRLANALPAAQL